MDAVSRIHVVIMEHSYCKGNIINVNYLVDGFSTIVVWISNTDSQSHYSLTEMTGLYGVKTEGWQST